MKSIYYLLLTSFIATGCVQQQVDNSGKMLNAQAPGAPLYSPLDAPTIVSPSHQVYSQANQNNPLHNAVRGAVVGGALGNWAGGNTQATVIGAGAGAALGYTPSMYNGGYNMNRGNGYAAPVPYVAPTYPVYPQQYDSNYYAPRPINLGNY